jgi:predicted RNA-binding Zn-ribbon protein involved in translation (DUF1610 family)
MYAWRLGDQIWSPENIIRDWCVLSISFKWLFEAKSFSMALTPKEALAHDDRRLVEKVHEYLEQADIVIAHNGDHFDLPKMNTRFLFWDFPPTSPYISIDTRDTAKKAFGFTSNKLAYLAQYLGLPAKLPTDFDLWVRCAHGDKEAIEYMRVYNEQDIYTLEEVYVRMRPWIKHPNMGLYMDAATTKVCPRCGSDDLNWGDKYRTSAGIYDAFKCNHCGGSGRAKKSTRTSTTRVV